MDSEDEPEIVLQNKYAGAQYETTNWSFIDDVPVDPSSIGADSMDNSSMNEVNDIKQDNCSINEVEFHSDFEAEPEMIIKGEYTKNAEDQIEYDFV